MVFNLKTLAVSLLAFAAASLYVQNGVVDLTLFMFPQAAVYFLLGFFHAHNVWSLDNLIRKKQDFFPLISYTILYTGWYNVVLLPESGLGYIEWAIVFIALTMNFINEAFAKKIHNPFMGQRPLVLLFFGLALFLLKMFLFYVFKDNIYESVFLQNDTARNLVGIFSVCGIGLLLMQLYQHITNRFGINIDKKKAHSWGKKLTRMLGGLLRKVFQLLTVFCTLPVVLIVVSSAGLIALIIAFKTANEMYQDILALMEPFLAKILSTGENRIHPSHLYSLLQTVAMMTVLFYTVYIEKNMKTELKNNIEKEISRQLEGQPKYDELFPQIRKELLNSNFNAQLQLLDNKTLLKKKIESMEDNENEGQ